MKLNPIDEAIMATFPHQVPCKATEAASIRGQLRLRISNIGQKEVYTTIHGTHVWRWFSVSDSDFEWYRNHFGLTVENIPMENGEVK